MTASGPDGRPHEHCSQCGFDGSRYDDPELLDAIRTLIPRWKDLLASAGPELRDRPHPTVWSAFEYAAHSRDITALHVLGVMAALRAGAAAPGSWSRGLVISGTRMDVRALLEHALHDSTHHVADVELGLLQLRR